ASTTAATQPPVTGTIHGRFLANLKTAKRAATYRLNATATLSGLGKVQVTGTAIGAIVKGSATGTLRLANAKGAVTLSLNVPAVTNAMATPSSFAYTVTRATGAYKKLAGSGILNLAFTATNKRGTAGTFKLVLAGGIASLA
ncbi:MAG TPA: hypothetical protein VGI81_13420, partial [Tepidisphaeraceae bacterium]